MVVIHYLHLLYHCNKNLHYLTAMGFLKVFAAFQAVCLAAQASPLRPAQVTERAVTWSTFSNVKIFGPGSGFTAPGVLYGRTAIINETLYATAENCELAIDLIVLGSEVGHDRRTDLGGLCVADNSGLPVSPIYKSQDAGKTWNHVTDVKDTVNGFGLTWEPDLYVLPTAIGSYPAGTLLLAIDSVPKNRSTYKIDIYASLDQGVTWKFVSNVAKGGAIYEPFMLAYQGQLIVYFSDNRDSRYSQKLTHVTSKDLVNWSATSDDVTGSQSDRPGMATVAALPNGQWIMTYENGISSGGGYNFPVR